ncbi:MAG: 4-(cytidine 5'-diphospho)-2-C-methyl-D-erythritol kinase [Duodenibacillus sp.]|nr:4-(cytidine 5'-diphospho)-2-C-methyl-D-erythritol kinase [Duodenibacillus sp.]
MRTAQQFEQHRTSSFTRPVTLTSEAGRRTYRTGDKLTNLAAPAKMNLFLHVTGRREDGMHLLESLFVLINLEDTLEITLTDDGVIERTGDIVGATSDDLCVRAATLLQEVSGTHLGAKIHVVKRIPSGAGLGGGSSDCATTLIALNRLWGLNYSRQKLMQLGDRLGADVAFFIYGQNAIARSTGSELTALEVPEGWWALLMPGVPTSTHRIFADPDLTRNTKSLTIPVLSDRIRACWPALYGHNDLQPVAARINPQIQTALAHLGDSARMTGSGSAVFAAAATPDDAQKLLGSVPEGMRGWVVATLRRHPLFEF